MSLQSIINKSWDKLKTIFIKIDWSKVLPFFLFLILAFIFWMFLFFERSTDGSHRIPIKYVNMPKDEVFVEDVPSHIDLKIRDHGKELFRYLFSKKDSLHIDVIEAQKNNKVRLQGNDLKQLIHTKLFSSTDIIGYIPASIPIKTSRLYSKIVPVVFDGERRTSARHLVVDSISIIPNEVKILGTKELVENITEVVTEYTVFENLKATSQLPAKLKAIEGISFEPNVVDIYIPIYEFTERSFEIPILSKNTPSTLDVKFFPSRAKISFSVTLDNYKKISPDDFEIMIDYNSLRKLETDQVELKLTKYPSFILNPKLSPEAVEFLFEYK